MGIPGLLPLLKTIQKQVTLKKYMNQTLAIDGYAWLHRASCACAFDLVMGRPTNKYLQFFIKRLQLLKRLNITPYVVFDGDSLFVKSHTEIQRKKKRLENELMAKKLWSAGDRFNAMEYFQKSVDVTPEMAKCIIDYCKVHSITYIVAPFEADAQMVYLEKMGLIQGIISEDSDLLVFGCKTLITKLNDHGEALEISRDNFASLPESFPLGELSEQQFRNLVCLAGCDYTSGIWKVGLITAMKIVKQYSAMKDILAQIEQTDKFRLSKTFKQEVEFANYAFQYQRVFCPISNQITTLNHIPQPLINCHAEILKIIGCIGSVVEKRSGIRKDIIDTKNIDHKVHERIAKGELNPVDITSELLNREKELRARKPLRANIIVGGSDLLKNVPRQFTVRTQSNIFNPGIPLESKGVSLYIEAY
ncbi:hypothetical protein SUVZ_02G3800 [Saccharomyces uvarum]|uniref:Exonuclease 1 n=1 Tax=Saccharomyces uvarum TaxID=230603 RepID=A0ABN8WNU7_SACUV|nr:hypothetical protein SUVZ_02G3800 [Saccharomyces uvarum]